MVLCARAAAGPGGQAFRNIHSDWVIFHLSNLIIKYLDLYFVRYKNIIYPAFHFLLHFTEVSVEMI